MAEYSWNILLAFENVVFAFGRVLVLPILRFAAGALSLSISHVPHAVKVTVRNVVDVPANAARMVTWI